MSTFNRKLFAGILVSAILLISVIFIYKGVNDGPEFKKVRSSFSPKAGVEAKKARTEYFFKMLRDPASNSIPENIRARELEFQKKLPKADEAFRKANKINAIDWKEAGPNDVGGRTRALAVDVTNSNVIIAGGVSGGIWKSTDNGASWSLKSSSVNDLSVTSLAQDPRSGHTNTWYYCSGEFRGNTAGDLGGKASFSGGGVYKSTDNGESWNKLAVTASNPNVWDSYFDYASKIVVSKSTGSVFLASNAIGIMRSTNGGTSFSLVLGNVNDHYYTDVEVNANGTLVASLSEYGYNSSQLNSPGIYKSTNDGVSWSDITPGSFPANHQRTVIALAPSNQNIIYTFTNTGGIDGYGEEDLKFFKINISTGTSEDRSANLPNFRTSGVSYASKGFLTTQGNYDMALAVKPDDENFVVIGGTSLFRSFDGFATQPSDVEQCWIGGYGQEVFFHPDNHPDHHALVFDPANPVVLWNGHDGGLSRSSNILNTTYSTHFPWGDMNKGYNVTQFYSLDIPYTAYDNRIMGGTQDNGTPFFTYNGSTTASIDLSSGDGAYCRFGGSYAYVSSQNGHVLRLGYNGQGYPNTSWSYIYPNSADGQLFISPFTIDPSNNNVMYYCSGDDLWRNTQLGSLPDYQQEGVSTGWNNIYTVDAGYNITAINVSRSNSASVLYFGASYSGSPEQTPKIYKLTSATSSTTPVDISVPGAVAGAYVHNIAINPDNANEIIVIFSNYNVTGVYHSTNGGSSYTAIEGNLTGNTTTPGPSIRCASILPGAAGTMYFLGTSTGLYVTTVLNGASTVWTQEGSTKIGNTVVAAVESRKLDGRVVAATHGRGAFVADNVVVGVEQGEGSIAAGYALEQNYPNPFNPSTVIKYSLAKSSEVNLTVFDATGRKVTELVNGRQNSGSHSVSFDASGMASGVYFYTIKTSDFTETKRMVLLK